MMKKVIGITANLVTSDNIPYFDDCKKMRLYTDYHESIIDAGAVPIIIPVTTNQEVLDQYIEMIDALVITGGYDIDPLRYNEEPHEKLSDISPERDEYEFYLVEKAMENNLPILGICRGHQVLNVANGGTLYQDISLAENTTGVVVKHIQQALCKYPTHKIDIEEDTMLYEIFGKEVLVNSFHHLAVKDVAQGFKVSARAKDGIIEAIESKEGPFMMGVQWHPEALSKTRKEMARFFDYFIKRV